MRKRLVKWAALSVSTEEGMESKGSNYHFLLIAKTIMNSAITSNGQELGFGGRSC